MVLETLKKLFVTARVFEKTFTPKIGKMGQKQGLLNLKRNSVIDFHGICSLIKIFVICCVPAQILYWEKIFYLQRFQP